MKPHLISRASSPEGTDNYLVKESPYGFLPILHHFNLSFINCFKIMSYNWKMSVINPKHSNPKNCLLYITSSLTALSNLIWKYLKEHNYELLKKTRVQIGQAVQVENLIFCS